MIADGNHFNQLVILQLFCWVCDIDLTHYIYNPIITQFQTKFPIHLQCEITLFLSQCQQKHYNWKANKELTKAQVTFMHYMASIDCPTNCGLLCCLHPLGLQLALMDNAYWHFTLARLLQSTLPVSFPTQKGFNPLVQENLIHIHHWNLVIEANDTDSERPSSTSVWQQP